MRVCDIKNRGLIIILLLTVIILTASLCRTTFKSSAAELSDNAVIALTGEIDGERVSVDAVLLKNTGLNGLTVEISYDTKAMTLVNVEKGAALSSLDYITTNVDTEKGYGITPFKVNWSGDYNDESAGLLFKMEFLANENIDDGKYTVTLKTERGKSATYITNGEVAAKNVLINGVQVEVKGNKPQSVEEIPETESKANIFLWISISVAVVAVTGLIVLTVLKIKGKRSWTKIE